MTTLNDTINKLGTVIADDDYSHLDDSWNSTKSRRGLTIVSDAFKNSDVVRKGPYDDMCAEIKKAKAMQKKGM